MRGVDDLLQELGSRPRRSTVSGAYMSALEAVLGVSEARQCSLQALSAGQQPVAGARALAVWR